MNKKFIWIFAIILVVAVGGVYYFWNKQQSGGNTEVNTTYPQISNYTFYPIHEIKQNKFSSGTYNTEGYVVKIYTCPPCPKGAQCKPCMRDNIVISKINKLIETYTLSDNEMILFANNPKQFELGKKYKFSVKILDYKSTNEPINDVEIIGYNLFSNNTIDCYDCGEGGWQKMAEKCSQVIQNKNDYKNCLMNFTWSSVNQNTSIDEIKEGYIEIGGSEILKNPTSKSIKVFIYHQWAVDEEGNLYLLGQLG
jgi:hypothetical protein